MTWYLIMVLVHSSLVADNTDHLFLHLLPFVHRLWRNTYSDVVSPCILCYFSY